MIITIYINKSSEPSTKVSELIKMEQKYIVAIKKGNNAFLRAGMLL